MQYQLIYCYDYVKFKPDKIGTDLTRTTTLLFVNLILISTLARYFRDVNYEKCLKMYLSAIIFFSALKQKPVSDVHSQ